MSFYYNNHIRNLQSQALIERQKIQAQLYEQKLLNKRQVQESRLSNQENSLRRSRKEENQELGAFLERSRLEAQSCAQRLKAENTMNRSRLQKAFELRKVNQKGYEKLEEMNKRHFFVQQQARRQEDIATTQYLTSQRQLQETLRYQNMLLQSSRENKYYEDLQAEYRYNRALLDRNRYL